MNWILNDMMIGDWTWYDNGDMFVWIQTTHQHSSQVIIVCVCCCRFWSELLMMVSYNDDQNQSTSHWLSGIRWDELNQFNIQFLSLKIIIIIIFFGHGFNDWMNERFTSFDLIFFLFESINNNHDMEVMDGFIFILFFSYCG